MSRYRGIPSAVPHRLSLLLALLMTISLQAEAQTAVRTVEVKTDRAILRVGPHEDFDRLTPQMAGNRLVVEGKQGGWLKVRLGTGRTGWIQAGDVTDLPAGTTPPQARLRDIVTRPANDAVLVEFHTSQRGAVEVRDEEAPIRLVVTLAHTTLATMEVTHPEGTDLIAGISLEQVADGVVEARIDVTQPRLWGYELRPAPFGFVLDVRKPPAVGKDLTGITVVLDPGHGGDDSGAVGLNGTNEKDVNLAVASALSQKLEQNGARVVMTRETDVAVATGPHSKDRELSTRVDVSRGSRGTIFISVHHNAMPKVEDGRVAHGSLVYYYRPQSRPLAQAIASTMGAAVGEPTRGYIWRSFHVIRQTEVPSVLLEVQFISNPEMEARMRTPEYIDQASTGVYQGIRKFFGLDLNP